MYAVIKTGGKQHRVCPGDVLNIEKIKGNKGDTVVFEEVLLVASEGSVRVGAPIVPGAKVIGEIAAQTKAAKINVFRMKRRKSFRKKTGHRQQLTTMKIKEITI
jgi:large subunit ribosomal protein L21